MRPGPDPRAARWIAVRIGVLAVLFASGFTLVAFRVFAIQVIDRDGLVGDMVEQYRRQLVLKPRRGPVVDRAGVLLAGSADAQSIYADPVVLAREDGGGAALRKVSQALGLDMSVLLGRLGIKPEEETKSAKKG